MSGRTSGVQREVIHLYRQVLRAARVKDTESRSTRTSDLVKAEFRHQVSDNVMYPLSEEEGRSVRSI